MTLYGIIYWNNNSYNYLFINCKGYIYIQEHLGSNKFIPLESNVKCVDKIVFDWEVKE